MSRLSRRASRSASCSCWGQGVNATVERWGDLLRADHSRERADRYADRGLSHLGYWTDNGGFYYYETEEGLNEQDTLAPPSSRR